MPDTDGVPILTRVMLGSGCCCEIERLDTVLDRICASLEAVPPTKRRELARALLAMAVAYIGGYDAAALPSCDSRA